jgi:hypothetical protein
MPFLFTFSGMKNGRVHVKCYLVRNQRELNFYRYRCTIPLNLSSFNCNIKSSDAEIHVHANYQEERDCYNLHWTLPNKHKHGIMMPNGYTFKRLKWKAVNSSSPWGSSCRKSQPPTRRTSADIFDLQKRATNASSTYKQLVKVWQRKGKDSSIQQKRMIFNN